MYSLAFIQMMVTEEGFKSLQVTHSNPILNFTRGPRCVDVLNELLVLSRCADF